MAEFAVVELAAALGMSTDAGKHFLGDAIELAYRLPRTSAEVTAGRVPAWRARRIAQRTRLLPPAGATWVDQQVAAVAGRVGPIVLDRLVTEAVVRFDPKRAAADALRALDHRHADVTIEHILDGALSTGHLDAVLDVADALELEATLSELAAGLAAAGDTSPLDVRRAKALGLLARGEVPKAPRRRRVVLHVHLSETVLQGCGDGIATLKTHTGHPLGQVSVEQVRDWCATPDAEITVKPVLDVLTRVASAGYQPSAWLRDVVVALNVTCVFPYCHRPAESLDLDHILAYANGGETSTENLAPLCRRHHRAKTFAAWTYTRLGPGEYLWTSPHGYSFVTDQGGTHDATRDTRPEPPDKPPGQKERGPCPPTPSVAPRATGVPDTARSSGRAPILRSGPMTGQVIARARVARSTGDEGVPHPRVRAARLARGRLRRPNGRAPGGGESGDWLAGAVTLLSGHVS